jgi:protein-tyrosine-phosphatase
MPKRRCRHLTPKVRRSLQTQLQLALIHLHSHSPLRSTMLIPSLKPIVPFLAYKLGVFDRIYLSALHTALAKTGPLNILIVCKGNICRSAYANERLAYLLASFGPIIEAKSAGLWTKPGKPANPDATRNAALRGVDLGNHLTSSVTEQNISAADIVFIMDGSNRAMIRRSFPSALAKTVYLGALDPERKPFSSLEITDPYGKSDEVFGQCFEKIDRCLNQFLAMVSAEDW